MSHIHAHRFPFADSGDPSWLGNIRDLIHADAIGLHPYGKLWICVMQEHGSVTSIVTTGKRPFNTYPSESWGFGGLPDSLRDYHDATQLPIWITEFGSEVDAYVDMPFQAFSSVDQLSADYTPILF